jgi:hypothetical protein
MKFADLSAAIRQKIERVEWDRIDELKKDIVALRRCLM